MSTCYESYTMHYVPHQWGYGRELDDHKLTKPSIMDAPSDIVYVITL